MANTGRWHIQLSGPLVNHRFCTDQRREMAWTSWASSLKKAYLPSCEWVCFWRY